MVEHCLAEDASMSRAEAGGVEESARRPARIAGPSRVTAMTMVFVAALLCTKLAGPSAAVTPSKAARELAVRELLTATSGKQSAVAVKDAKMSAVHSAAAALAGKGSMIKKVQKLDEEAPAEEAPTDDAPATEEAPTKAEPVEGKVSGGDLDKGNDEPKDDMLPGWDKSGWSSGDWASWVITGPFITICFSFFMFYTYGVPAGALTLIICAIIDVATFYYNW